MLFGNGLQSFFGRRIYTRVISLSVLSDLLHALLLRTLILILIRILILILILILVLLLLIVLIDWRHVIIPILLRLHSLLRILHIPLLRETALWWRKILRILLLIVIFGNMNIDGFIAIIQFESIDCVLDELLPIIGNRFRITHKLPFRLLGLRQKLYREHLIRREHVLDLGQIYLLLQFRHFLQGVKRKDVLLGQATRVSNRFVYFQHQQTLVF